MSLLLAAVDVVVDDQKQLGACASRHAPGAAQPALLLSCRRAPRPRLHPRAPCRTHLTAALAHQNDFDVCWPRGSIAETIFTPLVGRITAAGGRVLGGQLVTDLVPGADGASVSAVVSRDVSTGEVTSHECDAVVFAIGISGMQKLVGAVPLLGERAEFRAVMNLRSIDVIATRLVSGAGLLWGGEDAASVACCVGELAAGSHVLTARQRCMHAGTDSCLRLMPRARRPLRTSVV